MRGVVANTVLAGAVVFGLCGPAAAQEARKDWYVALRFGFQPYTVDVEGELLGREFEKSADLLDLMKDTDTMVLGGEVEFGKGPWFVSLASFYQKTKADEGNEIVGLDLKFTETGLNPMVGYRVYETLLGGDRALAVDLMAGVYYVKVPTDIALYAPAPIGNRSASKDIDFLDPMVGARAYLAITKKFGFGASGQIGGFGVGSELNYSVAGNLVYNFTNWFAASAGYKYWYWKYEDSGATLSELEQALYGPVVGVQFKF